MLCGAVNIRVITGMALITDMHCATTLCNPMLLDPIRQVVGQSCDYEKKYDSTSLHLFPDKQPSVCGQTLSDDLKR